MSVLKFVEIVWIDARSQAQWVYGEDFPQPQKCYTRGWLVHEEIDFITIAGTLANGEESTNYSEVISIPMGCIEEFNELVITYKSALNGIGT